MRWDARVQLARVVVVRATRQGVEGRREVIVQGEL